MQPYKLTNRTSAYKTKREEDQKKKKKRERLTRESDERAGPYLSVVQARLAGRTPRL